MKASQQHSINYSKVAILGIVAVIVAGIWVFHFDDELFGSLFQKHDSKSLTKPVETAIKNRAKRLLPSQEE